MAVIASLTGGVVSAYVCDKKKIHTTKSDAINGVTFKHERYNFDGRFLYVNKWSYEGHDYLEFVAQSPGGWIHDPNCEACAMAGHVENRDDFLSEYEKLFGNSQK